MAESILIVAAHSDDQIIGVGGTAAKYAREGHDVYTVIFSQGEISHPHLQKEFIVPTRERESINANRIIGGKEVIFLEIAEKDINNKKVMEEAKKKLEALIRKINPVRIFTHSLEDAHPVHKKTVSAILKIVDNHKDFRKTEVLAFDIWTPFKFSKKKYPKMIIDISQDFKTKNQAIKAFKSQFNLYAFLNYFVYWAAILNNFLNGRKHETRFAEVFYKLR